MDNTPHVLCEKCSGEMKPHEIAESMVHVGIFLESSEMDGMTQEVMQSKVEEIHDYIDQLHDAVGN